jgi:hypothetical protein
LCRSTRTAPTSAATPKGHRAQELRRLPAPAPPEREAQIERRDTEGQQQRSLRIEARPRAWRRAWENAKRRCDNTQPHGQVHVDDPAPAQVLREQAAHGRAGGRSDIVDNIKKAITTVDPTPYFQKYGDNVWAVYKEYLDAVTNAAAAPVIAKYTGVLGAADVFTASTTFWAMQSLRLDLGLGSQVHP